MPACALFTDIGRKAACSTLNGALATCNTSRVDRTLCVISNGECKRATRKCVKDAPIDFGSAWASQATRSFAESSTASIISRTTARDTFWTHLRSHPPAGFEQPVARLMDRIEASQSNCSRRCTCVHCRGGTFASLHCIAQCLLSAAVVHNCAIVDEDIWGYPWTGNLVTSAHLKKRCIAASRTVGIACYFRRLSSCPRTGAKVMTAKIPTWLPNVYVGFQPHDMEPMLRTLRRSTGLTSELLAMGVLMAWVMRPTDDLHAALEYFGGRLGLPPAIATHASPSQPLAEPSPTLSARPPRHHTIPRLPRFLAMHIRHGDRNTIADGYLGAEKWRVSAASFKSWARRVGSVLGVERVLLLTDDPEASKALMSTSGAQINPAPASRTSNRTAATAPSLAAATSTNASATASVADEALEAASDYALRVSLAPMPWHCFPSFRAGVLGKNKHVGPGYVAPDSLSMRKQLAKVESVLQHRHKSAEDEARLGKMCGPPEFQDDGMLLFAGVMLLGRCTAFIGSPTSNVARAALELISTHTFPSATYDPLNDMYAAYPIGDNLWYGGVTAGARRPIREELMMDIVRDP